MLLALILNDMVFEKYGYEAVRELVDFALEHARQTKFDIQTFMGVNLATFVCCFFVYLVFLCIRGHDTVVTVLL